MTLAQFFFGNIWHFLGLVVVLVVIFEGLEGVVKAWRSRSPRSGEETT